MERTDENILQIVADFSAASGGPEVVAASSTVRTVSAPGSGNALEIQFSPEQHFSGVRIIPVEPWDWSAYRDFHFAMDVSNVGSESVQLYLSMTDIAGDFDALAGNRAMTANRSINVSAGETGTVFFVLDGPTTRLKSGKRENPSPWATNDRQMTWRYGDKSLSLASINEIWLTVRGNITPKSVLIDNLRLRRNPPHDLSFLEGIVDEFGQNATLDYPTKVHSADELREAANRELAELEASGPMPDRSRFGGWKDGPKLEATGFFRVEKVNDKWWMVDPEGHLFFSHGVANVRMANLTTFTGIDFEDDSIRYVDNSETTPEDSIGRVPLSATTRETRFVASDVRHKMFNWLPEYSDGLADHYSFRRSALMGPLDGGETFSFYSANLERRYGEIEAESYLRQWEEVTLARMNAWGFTSFGNWVDPAFYANQKVPYFANGWIIGDYKTLSSEFDVWGAMPDPYDPAFIRRAEVTISVIADEIQASPWCVGIFVDNEKSWGYRTGTVEQRYGIILDALSQSSQDSPAKAAFTSIVRAKYGSVAAVNTAWATAFASWSEFSDGVVFESYSVAAVADLSILLEALSEQYFQVVHGTVERYLPNHLYMGARMANWGMPDETIKASIKYSDVLSFNIYEEGMQPHAWRFLEDVDLPTVIGEFHIGASRETGLFHPGLVQADDQADRAAKYIDYMESVARSDWMVGAHWFQYVDSPITGRAFDGEGYNVGFVNVADIPYPEMVEAAKSFNSTVYKKRYAGDF